MKALRKLDGITTSLLMFGAFNWGIAAFSKRDAVGSEVRHRTALAKPFYGLVAFSAAYKLLRAIGPKPKQERDIEKIARIYERFDHSTKQLNKSVRQFNDIRLKTAKLIGRKVETLRTS